MKRDSPFRFEFYILAPFPVSGDRKEPEKLHKCDGKCGNVGHSRRGKNFLCALCFRFVENGTVNRFYGAAACIEFRREGYKLEEYA